MALANFKGCKTVQKNVMVDLETLGQRPGCRILSIGAVEFGPAGLGAEFYVECFLSYQGELVIEEATRAWWADQPAEVRGRLFDQSAEGKVKLRDALTQLTTWLCCFDTDAVGGKGAAVWGNGADFDNAILQVAYAAVNAGPPGWHFYSNRCYRTLKALRPATKLVRVGRHHNALDDAKSQAEHAVRLLTELQAWA
jgi:hypothetical protein